MVFEGLEKAVKNGKPNEKQQKHLNMLKVLLPLAIFILKTIQYENNTVVMQIKKKTPKK